MSLEFTMWSEDGRTIERDVSLLYDNHTELMSLFKDGLPGLYYGEPDHPLIHFPLLARVRDYWNDANFSAAELHALKSEMERLLPQASPALAKVLRNLIGLTGWAADHGRSIVVMAD